MGNLAPLSFMGVCIGAVMQWQRGGAMRRKLDQERRGIWRECGLVAGHQRSAGMANISGVGDAATMAAEALLHAAQWPRITDIAASNVHVCADCEGQVFMSSRNTNEPHRPCA
ncbi:hypothetical protein ABFU51_15455 [Xanthomonas campestris pv. raphani]|uniref:hypothetical protein n=1 Tax=Xanthomonas campestris TaxID=339 RepID=UPI00388D6FDE